MKDSTALIICGLIAQVFTLAAAALNIGLPTMAGCCIIGTVLIGFGLFQLASDN